MSNFKFIKSSIMPKYEFVRAPKKVLHSNLSVFARLLYIAMLERLSLSVKNLWTDSENNVYIIYTVKEAMSLLDCCKTKAVKTFAELDGVYIKRKRQGLGLPDLIYLADVFANDVPENKAEQNNTKSKTQHSKSQHSKSQFMNNENNSSETLNFKASEVYQTDSNNNKYNKIKKNNINPIYPFCLIYKLIKIKDMIRYGKK